MAADFNEIFATANHFRKWVCSEISHLNVDERSPLRGDYVFVIDGMARFIVFIDANWSGSTLVLDSGVLLFDESVPFVLSKSEFESLAATGFRVKISTDSETLKRLLHGTIRARVAYLTGLVSIEGDLPVFLRLVGHLKARGIRPILKPDLAQAKSL